MTTISVRRAGEREERLEAGGASKNWILNHMERLTGSWVWVLVR